MQPSHAGVRLWNGSGNSFSSKPAPEQIQAAQNWTAKNKDFDKRIVSGDHSGNFEAETHALTMQKKALPSYPRLKKASQIRAYFIGIPICLIVLALVLFTTLDRQDVDDQETADNEEAVDNTASAQWFENSSVTTLAVEYHLGLLRRWLFALGD
jgi:hypothetical protein